MPIELSLFWLLLPVAAASGWYLARRVVPEDKHQAPYRDMAQSYLKGCNFVLNEQPDKAIEVFIKLLEVESETVETHLALGNLFRRRGEVDRAIRIHQNLVARTNITQEQRNLAALELGMDYLRSGLLDRAESLFKGLLEAGSVPQRALKELVDIYQQEQDWPSAIASAEQLQAHCGEDMRKLIAQLYCEQAKQCQTQAQEPQALDLIQRALKVDPGCVRASLMEGKRWLALGDPERALPAFARVENQDPEFLVEALPAILSCYQAAGRTAEFKAYLAGVSRRPLGTTLMLVVADLIAEQEGPKAAINYLSEQLRRRASIRGLDSLVRYLLHDCDATSRRYLETLREITQNLLCGKTYYKCRHCGLAVKSLHWQCPGCKHWASIKPIQGMEGD
jgi:lipopolysaccharide biosynthesis regulator YciM